MPTEHGYKPSPHNAVLSTFTTQCSFEHFWPLWPFFCPPWRCLTAFGHFSRFWSLLATLRPVWSIWGIISKGKVGPAGPAGPYLPPPPVLVHTCTSCPEVRLKFISLLGPRVPPPPRTNPPGARRTSAPGGWCGMRSGGCCCGGSGTPRPASVPGAGTDPSDAGSAWRMRMCISYVCAWGVPVRFVLSAFHNFQLFPHPMAYAGLQCVYPPSSLGNRNLVDLSWGDGIGVWVEDGEDCNCVSSSGASI